MGAQASFQLHLAVLYMLVLYAAYDLSSRSRSLSYLLFLVFPVCLLPLNLAGEWNGWFNIVKYATMAFVGAYATAVRFDLHGAWACRLLAFLAPINILEAMAMEAQSGKLLNALSSLVLILLFPSPKTVRVEDGPRRDIVCPMSWHAIAAYNVWHLTLAYGFRSWEGVAGEYLLVDLIVLAIPMAVALSRGRQFWLQARAYTLAMWLILEEASVVQHPEFWPLTHGVLFHETTCLVLGGLSLAINAGLLIHLARKRPAECKSTNLARLTRGWFRPRSGSAGSAGTCILADDRVGGRSSSRA